MRFLVLGILFLLSACNEEYGEDTKKFVNRQVPGLSLKIAETGYEKKLYQGFIVEFSKLMLQAENVFKVISDAEVPLVTNMSQLQLKEAQTLRQDLLEREVKFLQSKIFLETLIEEQDELLTMCEEMDETYLREVVKAEIFNIATPKKVEEYYVGTNLVESLVRNVISQFSSQSQAKQNSIMEDAILSIPEKIPSSETLKVLYKKKCIEAKEAFKASEEVKEFEETFKKMIALVETDLALIRRYLSVVSAKIYQLAYADLYEKYGIEAVDESEKKLRLTSTISQKYAKLVDDDFKIMKKLVLEKDKKNFQFIRNEWEERYTERLKLLNDTKDVWPFYEQKLKETLSRKSNVDLIADLYAGRLPL